MCLIRDIVLVLHFTLNLTLTKNGVGTHITLFHAIIKINDKNAVLAIERVKQY